MKNRIDPKVNGKLPEEPPEASPEEHAEGPAEDLAVRARRTLQEAQARKSEACALEIKTALERHRCRLSIRQEWVDGAPATPPQVICVPLE